ncbi:helix-turn-helix transcriptional regulator [Coprobacter tertius]|uniref:LuxR C-terminal-related transcriptional regulator n=1 Tax=Coprobacter tertius TaxID=2944915 RepID=A0ABT1MGE9_9BACT|nr:LuxR C-terminal-related transcriptional regulator [Coprobacter tertius]MCP9611719.1 LuxR C-terminal-related transcriptional regulator [Coprobacter tertius]
METLTHAEWQVAYEYGKGLCDKEVADNLNKSVWTTKTQKRAIYRKLGISKDTELVLYLICMKLKRNFDLKEIRKHGIEVLFSVLFFINQCMSIDGDMYRTRTRSITRTSVRCRTSGRRSNDYEY